VESTLSSWHVMCRVGSDRGSCDRESEERWGDRRERREDRVATGRVVTPTSRG